MIALGGAKMVRLMTEVMGWTRRMRSVAWLCFGFVLAKGVRGKLGVGVSQGCRECLSGGGLAFVLIDDSGVGHHVFREENGLFIDVGDGVL